MTYALLRPSTLGLESFARATGLHPDFVRRLVALGVLETSGRPGGELRFSRSQLATAARVQRLRAGFSLNYAALGLVMDLLDRISELEAALRASTGAPRSSRVPPNNRRGRA